MSDSLIGSIFGLSCAVIWSLTVILYKGVSERLSPNIFNFTKNSIAFILLAITILVINGPELEKISSKDFYYLFISGFIGLGAADSLFLYCLKKIGAGWMAIVETAYTPFVFIFSYFLLSEDISAKEATGVFIIVGSLLLISLEERRGILVSRSDFLKGIAAGVASLALVAFGVVLTKVSLANVSLLYAVELRLLGGVLACIFLLLLRPSKLKIEFNQLTNYPSKTKLIAISIFGTYLTLILWVGGFKYQKATIVAVLNQTSTLFTLLASIVFLKEQLTPLKLLVACLAISGVIITIF